MKPTLLLPITLFAVAGLITPASAQVVVSLGSAANFGVLAATTVTNNGATVVNGDLGVSPGNVYTGFAPGVVNGTVHLGDPTASQAQADALTAFNVLAGEAFTADMSGQDLGNRTLTTGVYSFSSSVGLTGILTLDALGDANARFDFQTGTTLSTAIGSQIILINGAQAKNVYWQIGSSATFGTNSDVVGNVLAATSITASSGTMVDGRLLALNGAVTMDTNTITAPSAVPEPAAAAALMAGLIGLVAGVRRAKRPQFAPVAS